MGRNGVKISLSSKLCHGICPRTRQRFDCCLVVMVYYLLSEWMGDGSALGVAQLTTMASQLTSRRSSSCSRFTNKQISVIRHRLSSQQKILRSRHHEKSASGAKMMALKLFHWSIITYYSTMQQEGRHYTHGHNHNNITLVLT